MDQSVVMHLGLHGEDHPLSGQGVGRGPWRGVAGTRRWEGTEQGQDGRGAGGGVRQTPAKAVELQLILRKRVLQQQLASG